MAADWPRHAASFRQHERDRLLAALRGRARTPCRRRPDSAAGGRRGWPGSTSTDGRPDTSSRRLSAAVSEASTAIARHELPPTCLLQMHLDSGGKRLPEPIVEVRRIAPTRARSTWASRVNGRPAAAAARRRRHFAEPYGERSGSRRLRWFEGSADPPPEGGFRSSGEAPISCGASILMSVSACSSRRSIWRTSMSGNWSSGAGRTCTSSTRSSRAAEPPSHLLIENRRRAGYRLDPAIRFVKAEAG